MILKPLVGWAKARAQSILDPIAAAPLPTINQRWRDD
jgi:hypothetical protein